MATKAELEEKIQSLNNYIKRLKESNEHLQELVDNFDNKTKMYIQDGKDVAYYNWRNGNSEFLGRYIKEWVQDHLSLEVESEDNIIRARLLLDDYEFSSSSTWN